MSSKRRVPFAAVGTLFVALLSAKAAYAQQSDVEHPTQSETFEATDSSTPADVRIDAARDAFMRGVSHMQKGRFAEASVAFEESLRYDERASTLCNLAKAYDRRGDQEAKALAFYKRCAAHPEAERFRDHAKARAYAIEQARIERKLALQRGRHDAPEPGVQDTDDDSVTLMVLGLGALAIGGGVLVGSARVAIDAASTDRELAQTYPDGRIPERTVDGRPNPDVERLRDAEDQVTLSTGLLIGGAVVTTAGLGLLFAALIESAPESGEQNAAHVAVELSPNLAALRVRGRF